MNTLLRAIIAALLALPFFADASEAQPRASFEVARLGVEVETPTPDGRAGEPEQNCRVTIRGRHGGTSGRIGMKFSDSGVRTRAGYWVSLANSDGVDLMPGGTFSEVVDLDFACNARRRYRFALAAADGGGPVHRYDHYYPSEDDFTQETVIDLGSLCRFFEWCEPAPEPDPDEPVPDTPPDYDPDPITIDGVRIEGEWRRSESTYDPNDGMRIRVQGNRANILTAPASAHRTFEPGAAIWRSIQPSGVYRVLGSDGRYYPARLTLEGENVLHVDVEHNGAGNDQTWVRAEDMGSTSCPGASLQLDPAVAALVDPIVEEEIALQELVGLAVGVARNGQVVHLKGYGYANREDEVPVTEETLFRWASISKTITAAAAMLMWEEGNLDLDADISEIVPAFEDKPDGVITMRQLLSNTAGVEAYPDGWYGRAQRYPNASVYDPIAALDILTDSLLFAPGDGYAYSTMGFMLAGAVLNRIAEEEYGLPTGTYGSAFEEFVHTRIADPLCLTTLQNDYPLAQSPLDARRYAKDRNGVIYRVLDDSDEVVHWRLPGGGFQSTIRDLTLFANGLFSGHVLGDDGYDRLTTEVLTNDGRSTGYAQGLYVSHSRSGAVNRLGHGGVQKGVRSSMYYYPERDVAITILSNSTHTDRERLLDRIVNAVESWSWRVSDYDLTDHITCDSTRQTDSGNRFAGVWRDGVADQLIRRGYSRAAFQAERQRLADLDYHLTDLETFTTPPGARLWDGVFTKDAPRTRLWRNADLGHFLDKVDEWAREGWRLVDVETYEGADLDLPIQREWAGVFREEASRYELEQGLSTSAFHDVWEARSNDGFRLVDVEAYEDAGGQRQWAGVFVQGHGAYGLFRNVSGEDFAARRNDLRRDGLRLVDVEAYRGSRGQRLWALVGRAGTDNESVRIDKPFCGTWAGPLTGFWETHESESGMGRSLIDFEHFPD